MSSLLVLRSFSFTHGWLLLCWAFAEDLLQTSGVFSLWVYSSLSYDSSFLSLSGRLALYPRLRKSRKLCLCFPSWATSCKLTVGRCGVHHVCLLYSGITLLHCLVPSVMITALYILSGCLVTSDDRVNPIPVNCILIGKSAELLKMYMFRS